MNQTAILVGVNLGDADFEYSMQELENLTGACELSVTGVLTQNLEDINRAFYIGPGKLAELKMILESTHASMVIFNDELSPTQIRNIENSVDCRVIDRTMLILDIFARRAKTREAKLQVEIAHLQYMLPCLIASSEGLDQQTGGAGTISRGAGEKKLELSRRQIQTRVSALSRELQTLVEQRQTQRRLRKKTGIPVVSLVGYTNAGKSTIMNALLELSGGEEKLVFEKNMLFATLETSVRNITLPDRKSFLLTDTVGFVGKLPHHLVKAFRSTLEEVAEADLLIHVVDSSNAEYSRQIDVTNETLHEIGVKDIPMIYAYNKVDLTDIKPKITGENSVLLSAKQRDGIDELLTMIRSQIFGDYLLCDMLIPYDEGAAVAYLNSQAHILSTAYEPGGTRLTLECRQQDYNRYKQFIVD